MSILEDIEMINKYRIISLKLMLLTRDEVIKYLQYKNYYNLKNIGIE